MTAQQKIKILALTLFVSLVLNCFMLGNMAGQMSGGIMSDVMKKDKQMRDSLSDADKMALQQTINAYRSRVMQVHGDLVDARDKVRQIVRAQAFDQKAFDRAFADAKEQERAALKLIRDAREAAMKQMTPEGSSTLVNVTRLGFFPRDARADCLVR